MWRVWWSWGIHDFGVLKIGTNQEDVESCPNHEVERVTTSSTTNVNRTGQQFQTPKKPSVQAPPEVVGSLGPLDAVLTPQWQWQLQPTWIQP
jgi:hypothetical protein